MIREEPRSGGAVEGFRGRGFRVGGIDYPGAVVAHAGGARAWSAEGVAPLTPEDFADLPAVELLLIGTGATLERPPRSVLDALGPRFAVEVMDSRAAARTYNVLLAEGRDVAAALLPL